MNDPEDITKFDRNQAELEEFLLFCVVVAGKQARSQAWLLDGYLNSLPKASTPFLRIKKSISNDTYLSKITESRLGKYTTLEKCFRALLNLDLFNCTIDDLEAIPGIGPKTARLFLMHSRPNQRLAAIDTHVLKLLRANGVTTLKATPPAGKTYRMLEAEFLKLSDASGLSPADFDLQVWKTYSKAA